MDIAELTPISEVLLIKDSELFSKIVCRLKSGQMVAYLYPMRTLGCALQIPTQFWKSAGGGLNTKLSKESLGRKRTIKIYDIIQYIGIDINTILEAAQAGADIDKENLSALKYWVSERQSDKFEGASVNWVTSVRMLKVKIFDTINKPMDLYLVTSDCKMLSSKFRARPAARSGPSPQAITQDFLVEFVRSLHVTAKEGTIESVMTDLKEWRNSHSRETKKQYSDSFIKSRVGDLWQELGYGSLPKVKN